MKLFKSKKKIEKKSSSGTGCLKNTIDFLFSTYGYDITLSYIPPLLSYKLFHTISPLQGSVGKIMGAVSELPIVLRDEEKPDEILKNAPVLDLLNKPGRNFTKKKLFSGLSSSTLLTREMWIIARGPVKREPLELDWVYPFQVEIDLYDSNEWPQTITVSIGDSRVKFYRETVENRFRYFDKLQMNEIFPYIIDGGDTSGYSGFRGVSKLTSVKDELLSYSSSIVGNKASIDNGGRPSGIVAPEDDDLGEEQYEELEKSLRDYQGAENSGKIMLLPAKVKAMFEKWAPKDMDYEQLQKNVKSNIWRLYSIPAPIVSESGQTYSNFAEAQMAFYDEAVNDAWGHISDGLKWILETRYDLKGWKISYNELEVPALKARATKRMKELNESKSLTVNEIRKTAGYAEDPDGDNIVIPANSTTLSAVSEGASFGEPGKENPPEDD